MIMDPGDPPPGDVFFLDLPNLLHHQCSDFGALEQVQVSVFVGSW